MESRDLRILIRFAVKSVRKSFDSLSLAQDDRSGKAVRYIYCSNVDTLRATARVAPTHMVSIYGNTRYQRCFSAVLMKPSFS